jgi:hypothetical protein
VNDSLYIHKRPCLSAKGDHKTKTKTKQNEIKTVICTDSVLLLTGKMFCRNRWRGVF